MDYIQYAIEQLDKNNHGISAGRARDQYTEIRNDNAALRARVAELEEALREIEKAEGAFSLDQLTHAGNVIENSQRIAAAALKKVQS
jgi:succinate dehydrogenase/fumarate reductase flavoprotein subunit